MIHRNPQIIYNTILGKISIDSPYLLGKTSPSKPLSDMGITHHGRSTTVIRALTDFGIEESFVNAAKRFEEHYHFKLGPSAIARTTKNVATKAEAYIAEKLNNAEIKDPVHQKTSEAILIELDGCEIRTVENHTMKDETQRTPVYNNVKKQKSVNWRDVRLGFARNLHQESSKLFVGRMDSYPEVVSQMNSVAVILGMTPETTVVGVADGAPGLSEEMKKQFPQMQFILDKTHLKDHFYDTAEKLGISESQRVSWVEAHLKSVSCGNVENTLHELEDLYQSEPDHPNDRLRRLIGYIKRFSDSLDYKKFKEKGFPIGSGEIESAHKSIPQKRLKLPGAGWRPDSINPILSLRVIRANDWWVDFWEWQTSKLAA